MPIGTALVGIAFWVFLATVVVAEEMGKTKRRRADLDLVRAAMEKGQPLSPEVVREILARRTTGLFDGRSVLSGAM